MTGFCKIKSSLTALFISCVIFSQAQKPLYPGESVLAPPMAYLITDTLYTWTKPEQIMELRKSKKLLTKSRSETNGASLFDEAIHDPAFVENPLIRLLCEERFAKKRFAWTNGWGTVMGLHKEKYGDQLIQIVLSDSAIIGCFNNYQTTSYNKSYKLSFYTLQGELLDETYVIANAHRIAAVIHQRIRNTKPYKAVRFKVRGTLSHEVKRKWRKRKVIPTEYKEFVVINENMIKAWNYGTNSVKSEIESEINFLERIRDTLKRSHNNYFIGRTDWYRDEKQNGPYHKYNNGLCFVNKTYRLRAHNLKAIIRKLKKVKNKQSEALSK